MPGRAVVHKLHVFRAQCGATADRGWGQHAVEGCASVAPTGADGAAEHHDLHAHLPASAGGARAPRLLWTSAPDADAVAVVHSGRVDAEDEPAQGLRRSWGGAHRYRERATFQHAILFLCLWPLLPPMGVILGHLSPDFRNVTDGWRFIGSFHEHFKNWKNSLPRNETENGGRKLSLV